MTIIRRRRRRWRITKQDLDSGEISNDAELRRIECEVERESFEGNESGIVYVCLREREGGLRGMSNNRMWGKEKGWSNIGERQSEVEREVGLWEKFVTWVRPTERPH